MGERAQFGESEQGVLKGLFTSGQVEKLRGNFTGEETQASAGDMEAGLCQQRQEGAKGLEVGRVGERPLGDELLQPSMWRRGSAESYVRSCGCDNIATN